jgi:3-hydroxyisobutyrate dehydrogenase/glyoxylate/succinic semialdehyde reductase
MRIGFIGLGIMGRRMAANLLKHGNRLIVFNRTPDKAKPLIDQGAVWAPTPASVATQVDVLFTMLANPEAVKEVALGEEGLLNHLRAGSLWVDCSTVNPSFSRQMATEAWARGIRFLDAPVSGSKGPAASAELMFMVGGGESDFRACRSLLESMGSRIVHVGGHGQGTSLKMVINLLMGEAMAAFAEGMILGQSLGISQEMLFGILLGGPAVAPLAATKREKIESGKYDVEFPLHWMQKDLQLAAVTAYETGVALPLANVTKEIYRLAMRQGDGDEDYSAIYEFLSTDHQGAHS